MTPEENKLVHNIEVLGLTQQRAGELAGIPSPGKALAKPEVIEAREKLRQHMAVTTQITRESVIEGIKDAIDMARIINEPMPMIAGWQAISKILGYDKPATINVTINGDVREMRRQIKALPETELLQLADETGIIDADFYPVAGNG